MPRSRFQFRLSTLLWITAVVAGWFGGTEWQRRETRQEIERVWAEKEAAKWAIEIQQGQAIARQRDEITDHVMSERDRYRVEMMEKLRNEMSAKRSASEQSSTAPVQAAPPTD